MRADFELFRGDVLTEKLIRLSRNQNKHRSGKNRDLKLKVLEVLIQEHNVIGKGPTMRLVDGSPENNKKRHELAGGDCYLNNVVRRISFQRHL